MIVESLDIGPTEVSLATWAAPDYQAKEALRDSQASTAPLDIEDHLVRMDHLADRVSLGYLVVQVPTDLKVT